MVDTRDLKSLGQKCPCGFDSRPRHKTPILRENKRHKGGLQATTGHISKKALLWCFLFLSHFWPNSTLLVHL